jgi:hypothetical protein
MVDTELEKMEAKLQALSLKEKRLLREIYKNEHPVKDKYLWAHICRYL